MPPPPLPGGTVQGVDCSGWGGGGNKEYLNMVVDEVRWS